MSYVPEVTWGVTPAAALTRIRITGESLTHNKETIQSAEIRNDRAIADLVEVAASAGGGINFELSYGAWDPFFASLFGSSWSAQVLKNDISATFTAGTSSIAGTGISTSFEIGDHVRVRGAVVSGGANNKFFQVTAIPDANTLTVKPAPINEGPEVIDLDTTRLKMGVAITPFTIEKEHTDLTAGVLGKFIDHRGCYPIQLQLRFNARRILEGTMDFLGRDTQILTNTGGTGAPIAAPTNDVMNAVAGLGQITEAGVPLTTGFLGLSLTINGNLRSKPQIGSKYPYGIGLGSIVVTGEIDAYFETGALFQKAVNHDSTDLWFAVFDNQTAPTLGNAYVFSFQRIKFSTGGEPQSAGINQDVRERLGFQAILDPTSLTEMRFERYAAGVP